MVGLAVSRFNSILVLSSSPGLLSFGGIKLSDRGHCRISPFRSFSMEDTTKSSDGEELAAMVLIFCKAVYQQSLN